MIRRPLKVGLSEARRLGLLNEIDAAKEQLKIPKDLDGLYCAIWSEARAVISNNERLLQRGYEMTIVVEEE